MNALRNEGFTLVETLTALSVIAISLTLAVPSWNESRQKRHLIGASVELTAFLSSAQGLAVLHDDDVTVHMVNKNITDWCLGVTLGVSPCDCSIEDSSNDAYCAIGGARQAVSHADYAMTKLLSHSSETSFTFDHVRGILGQEDLRASHYFNLVTQNNQFGLQVNVQPTGRVTVCSFDSASGVPGFVICSPQLNDLPGALSEDIHGVLH